MRNFPGLPEIFKMVPKGTKTSFRMCWGKKGVAGVGGLYLEVAVATGVVVGGVGFALPHPQPAVCQTRVARYWVRPYLVENTISRPICEVKQLQAKLVLRSVMTREPLVLVPPHFFNTTMFQAEKLPAGFRRTPNIRHHRLDPDAWPIF